ncbi:MAG: hypothetical protein QW278_00665 [Desulfurococcaceae archaeon]
MEENILADYITSNRADTLKLLIMYELYGMKTLARFSCYVSKKNKIDAIVLLGDIISPNVVKWLSEVCGIKVLGVDGRLDGYPVITELKSKGGFISGKIVNLGRLVIAGLGLSSHGLSHGFGGIDVLVSYMQGRKYTCGGKGVDTVDRFIDYYRPRVVVMGNSSMPCSSENLYSPGSAKLGYAGVLIRNANGEFVFENMNYERYEGIWIDN